MAASAIWRDDDPRESWLRAQVSAAVVRWGLETQGWRDLREAAGFRPNVGEFLRWLRCDPTHARFAPFAEIVVHHPMPLFHMEHCVIAALLSEGRDHKTCGRPCDRHQVSLRDRAGMDHPVEADVGCRNTVFHAAAQSAADLVQIRDTHHRVGAGDPDGLELPLLQSAEHLDRGVAWLRPDEPLGSAPEVLQLAAVQLVDLVQQVQLGPLPVGGHVGRPSQVVDRQPRRA